MKHSFHISPNSSMTDELVTPVFSLWREVFKHHSKSACDSGTLFLSSDIPSNTSHTYRCTVYENLLLPACNMCTLVERAKFLLLFAQHSPVRALKVQQPGHFFPFAFFSYLQPHLLRVRFHALIKRTDLRGLFLICLNAATLFTGTYLQTNRRFFFSQAEQHPCKFPLCLSLHCISLTLAKCYRHVGVRADRKHVGFI